MTPPSELQKTYGDGLINRAVAAEILGISVSELRKRDKDKIYSFVTDEKGCHWYDEATLRSIAGKPLRSRDEIRKVVAKTSQGSLGRVYSKEDAALVFRELEKGKTLSAIVQDLKIHPETALAIQEVYGRVTGGIFLSRASIEKLGKEPLRGHWPPHSEQELTETLSASLSVVKCSRCFSRAARFCATCGAGSTTNGHGTHRAPSDV